jgi:hypothetical protein
VLQRPVTRQYAHNTLGAADLSVMTGSLYVCLYVYTNHTAVSILWSPCSWTFIWLGQLNLHRTERDTFNAEGAAQQRLTCHGTRSAEGQHACSHPTTAQHAQRSRKGKVAVQVTG